MIKLIEGDVASFYPREVTAMFKHRHQVFAERLGWVPPSVLGYEMDKFDDALPVYLVSVCPTTGAYQGSVRLLPTTGPNMLRDVAEFAALAESPIESATIWESSRICVADGAPRGTLAELVVGIGEVVLRAGLTGIVSVFDAHMHRLLTVLGCRMDALGGRQQIGNVECIACVFDPHPDHLVELKRKAKIVGSVLENEA